MVCYLVQCPQFELLPSPYRAIVTNSLKKSESNNGITRSAGLNKLKTGFKSKIKENSFVYPSVQLWNSAPPEITTETKEARARSAIRSYVKTLPI